MNQEIKAQWITALRSGDYRQGQGALRRKTDGEDTFCCLGVLCELAVEAGVIEAPKYSTTGVWGYGAPAHMGATSVLPMEVQEWSGVDSCGMFGGVVECSLTELNDNGTVFSRIADVIEAKF